MKSILKIFVLFIIICFPISSFAIEEVILDIDGEASDSIFSRIDDEEWYFDMGGKTLHEKIEEIKRKEIKDTSKSHYLLEEILTKSKSPNRKRYFMLQKDFHLMEMDE